MPHTVLSMFSSRLMAVAKIGLRAINEYPASEISGLCREDLM